ncbi:MAG: aminopeptidase N [Pseudomonadota bacterium]|nr:aminopeptidase N [Pseudomonadota bacterium]
MDSAPEPQPTRLSDYRPPAYLIDRVRLDVSLDPKRTTVKARLDMRRGAAGEGEALVLNGEHIELVSLKMDGQPVDAGRYLVGEKTLTIDEPPAAFTLDIETVCAPEENTALSGLYLSNGMFCTQCEAEGFRRIAYFLDRPDVLAKYTVRVEGDKNAAPVLLANGNLIEKGDLAGGRHFAVWEDPHPKPSYLFALVGGDLVAVEDEFVTQSGRRVALKVYVQPKNKEKCAYTLDSLKRAMRWDEQTFGREYDLDIFMIVAVDHFNFGAMENKGLNIFNSAYVLASPETATDIDYETIESIVAHEYFHNWSGNRVTCRDWFQLCLKEGFTVFRDQEFSADMRSRPVERIKEVRRLWSQQFPEDAGPLAHPVRPESYITIDNFYTATVYEKGAELVRMMKTLLGPEKFRAGCDLYFSRHDGTAATVEDFVAAMEEAGGADLKQFRRWYSDAGTPKIAVGETYDEKTGDYALNLSQKTAPTPGQQNKPPRHIPVAYALYGAKTGGKLAEGVAELKDEKAAFGLGRFGERPVASLLTGYSAPVLLDRELALDDRLLLAERDEDAFNRWAAVESLWRDLCLAFAGARAMSDREAALESFAGALRPALRDAGDDKALAAELLRCPSDADLARNVDVIDPGAIVAARARVRADVARMLRGDLRALYDSLRSNAPFEPTAEQAGERALKNAALSLLVAGGDGALALEQAKGAANMTDEAAATAALAMSDAPQRGEALANFYERWKGDSLVVNKWLAWNAMAAGEGALRAVEALLRHEAFDGKNPNKVRSVVGVFSRENLAGFHRADGAGYRFFADQLLAIDKLNPQLSARLSSALDNWRKLEPGRRALAEKELARVAAAKGISANLYEMTGRILAG